MRHSVYVNSKNVYSGGKTGRADKMDKILWVDGG